MNVKTTRFGTLDVDESVLLTVPRGLVGFAEQTGYCLIQHRPEAPFRWLQSTEEPALAFPVMDPSEFFTSYEMEITDGDVELLELTRPEDALVLVIVTVAKGGKKVTANLRAPVIINSVTRTAAQIVFEDNRYPIQHALVEQGSERPKSDSLKAA